MRYLKLAVALVAVLASAAPAAAQQATPRLQVGTWTGQVTPPDEVTVDVTYDVSYDADTLRLTVNAGEHGSFAAIAPKLEDGKISFGLQVGAELMCVLDEKEIGYAGLCTEAGGDLNSAGVMTMLPPAQPEKSQ
jgi:hypothetical protein